MIGTIRDFTGSINFSNALKVTLASVIPVFVFYFLGDFETGFTIAIGAFLTYPSDIPSNIRHKFRGVFVAALIVAGSNLFVNLIYPDPYIFYPVFALLVFFLSMISIYGQRATMVSFSALLAASLAFAHIHSGLEMVVHAGLMLVGGLFYLLISLLFEFIRPHHYVALQIAECIRLTSKYMKLRGDLWNPDANRSKIIEKQLHLQVELNATHENLREILIRNRSNAGSSDQTRKMLLIFISCVEILELALSTSFDHGRLHTIFENHPKVLSTYQNLAYNLGGTLKRISKSIENGTKYISKHSLTSDLEALEKVIAGYQSGLGNETASEGVLMITNMMHYAEKQIEKIRIIERAFSPNPDLKELRGRDKDLEKFIVPQHYKLETLRENLSFSSNIFRHSLRLTVTLMIGFLLGNFFIFQNSYWILLTIIVILRPGYGLTKQRSFDRIIGTVGGGAIAFGVLFFVGNHAVIGTLAVLSMLLGFAFTQINYKIGAGFVTMYVILLYGLLIPGSSQVVEFRIIDTVVGAVLAFAANYFLWPSWELFSLAAYAKKSIEANRNYLREISIFYNNKGEVTSAYRVSRKNAFIEVGNLTASFQRMAQEPKSKQKQMPQLYKLAELNHTLLSASASLGTYIQTHHTTRASEAFNVVVDTVIRNLEEAIAILGHSDAIYQALPKNDLEARFVELKNIRARELKDDPDFYLKMQEAQLVIEQLVWLINLSEGILKAVKRLDLTETIK
jgi:uncharacterized membrane protein (TIGR01666 family)